MIRLWPISKVELEKLREWRNTPDIMKWCRQKNEIEFYEQVRWFDSLKHEESIEMFSIYDGKVLVGCCGLTSINLENKRAEFSLYIGTEHQRKGYARAGLKELFNYGFNRLGLKSIWGESFDGNPAIKLFEEIGMKKEGTRRQFYFKNGKFIDAHLYSVLDSEWEQK